MEYIVCYLGTLAIVYLLGAHNSVALAVGDVISQPKVAELVDPAVRSYDRSVLQPLLLAVLSTQRLVLEVPLRPFVCLDVVLRVRRSVPAADLGAGRPHHHHLRQKPQLGDNLKFNIPQTTYYSTTFIRRFENKYICTNSGYHMEGQDVIWKFKMSHSSWRYHMEHRDANKLEVLAIIRKSRIPHGRYHKRWRRHMEVQDVTWKFKIPHGKHMLYLIEVQDTSFGVTNNHPWWMEFSDKFMVYHNDITDP